MTWLVGLSQHRPLVLLIEDLHWCDPTTLDAIGRLLDRVAGAPILVLMTARPEFEAPWDCPDVAHASPAATPHGRRGTHPARQSGGRRALPDRVVEQIVASAGGIPLYVEEVGRTVLEIGPAGGRRDPW